MASLTEVRSAIISDIQSAFLNETNTYSNGQPLGSSIEGVQSVISDGQASGTGLPGTSPVVLYESDDQIQMNTTFDDLVWDNVLRLVGFSKFQIYKARVEGGCNTDRYW